MGLNNLLYKQKPEWLLSFCVTKKENTSQFYVRADSPDTSTFHIHINLFFLKLWRSIIEFAQSHQKKNQKPKTKAK